MNADRLAMNLRAYAYSRGAPRREDDEESACLAAKEIITALAPTTQPRDDVRELLEQAQISIASAMGLGLDGELTDTPLKQPTADEDIALLARIDTALSQTDEQPRDDVREAAAIRVGKFMYGDDFDPFERPESFRYCEEIARTALSQTDEQPAIHAMTDAECATAYRDLRRRANDAGFATVGEWIDEQPDTDGLLYRHCAPPRTDRKAVLEEERDAIVAWLEAEAEERGKKAADGWALHWAADRIRASEHRALAQGEGK